MKSILFTSAFFFSAALLTAQESVSSGTQVLEKYLVENNLLTKKTDYGLYYEITRSGTGTKPRKGDYVMVNFRGKTLDGKVFDQNDQREPFVFQVGYRQVIRGWDVGITLLNVGSKGTLYLPPNLAYGKTGVGNQIPPNSPLIFEVELLKILNIDEYDQYMKGIEEKEKRAFKDRIDAQFKKDLALIKEYTSVKKMKATRLPSGLSYALKKKGKGLAAQPGDVLTVHYEGRLVSGEVFSKSYGSEPFQFVLGKGKVIPGWEEGLLNFKKGSEGWLLIPSKMAYGPRAIVEKDVNVPANSVLIFKIKVLAIQRHSKNKK